jgi:excisionase family DNA binding protein
MATGADLGLTEAAQVIGVSTKTIRRWIVSGELPAYRLRAGGGPLRVDAHDAELLSGHARPEDVAA